MPLPTLSDLWFWVMTAIVAGAGAYFGAYLKKRGENLATKEGLNDLIVQTAELTKTTKEIEASVSGRMWNQQRHWEMKRDALVSIMQALENVDDATISVFDVFERAANAGDGETESWKSIKQQRKLEFHAAINKFDRERILLNIVCSENTIRATRMASILYRTKADDLFKGLITSYRGPYGQMAEEFQRTVMGLYDVARQELGVNAETAE